MLRRIEKLERARRQQPAGLPLVVYQPTGMPEGYFTPAQWAEMEAAERAGRLVIRVVYREGPALAGGPGENRE